MKKSRVTAQAKAVRAKVISWKNYALAVICILVGVTAFSRGDVDGGLKGVLAGFAIITLLDAFGKVLGAIDANRQSLDGMRAAVEAVLRRRRS